MDMESILIRVIADVPVGLGILSKLSSPEIHQLCQTNSAINNAILKEMFFMEATVTIPRSFNNDRYPVDRKKVSIHSTNRFGFGCSVDLPVDAVVEDVKSNFYSRRVLDMCMNEVYLKTFVRDELGSCPFDEGIVHSGPYFDPDYNPTSKSALGVHGAVFLIPFLTRLLRWNRKTITKLTIESVPDTLYWDMLLVTSKWLPSILKTTIRFDALQQLEFSSHSSIKPQLKDAFIALSPNIN